MKEEELRKIAKCAMCGKGIGHTKLPLFWRVRIERYGLKMDALQRQQGLEMFLGGHVTLAQVMGPNEDMAEKISGVEITLCETCASGKQTVVAILAEMGSEDDDEKEETD